MTPPAGSGDDPDDGDDPNGGDEPRGSDDRNGPVDRDVEEPRGFIRSLLAILREMEERGERTRTGHSRPGPRTSVDYSIDIGGLSDVGEANPFRAGDERARAVGPRSDESAPDPHVTTRETPEGLVVVADLPGVDESAVETRLDRGEEVLVIEVSGTDAARLPLESDGWTVVDSRFANGVLEVELTRD